MKKLSLILLLIPCLVVQAQQKDRKWNIGIFGGTSEYAGDLGNGFLDFSKGELNNNWLGGITLSRYLSPSFDLNFTGTYGTIGYYKVVPDFKGEMQLGYVSFKYKLNNGYLIEEDSWLAPYILVGGGFTRFKGPNINSSGNNGIDYPAILGAGLNFQVSNGVGIYYQATYGYLSSDKRDNKVAGTYNDAFLLNTVGLNFNVGKQKDSDGDGVADRKDKCPNTPKSAKVDESGCPIDSDLDGVADYMDECPSTPGNASTKGCPDGDKDGVADKDDQCPNEPGSAELKGCPDTDGDGIIDSKDKCPNEKGSLAAEGCPDRDGDGVIDKEDLCPDVKGLAQFKGCPDTDGDGIEDSKDICPDKKGTVATNGCPDTDNDGVHDGIDKCPTVAGDPTHSGCPDTDADGVFDDIDKCPTVAGESTNQGCPEVKKEVKQLFQKALQGIQFETGKAVIKPTSFAILDAVAKVMLENPTYKLIIGGHTDDVGDDANNMTLSQNRADAVAKYLIGKGVDPLKVSATGYGETQPVDTNKTKAGQARNRRVELSVEFLN